MAEKYSTIQQHQPLRVPASFDKQGRALIVQLDEIFDDIYRRFGRLRVQDLGENLKELCLLTDEDGHYVTINTGIGEIRLEVGDIDGTLSSVGITEDGIDLQSTKYIKVNAGSELDIESDGELNIKSGGDMNIESGGTLNIESGGDLSVTGGNVTIEADNDAGGEIKIKSGGKFSVESDGDFEVDSANLQIDSTALVVKEGILKGDHYDMEGNPLMRRDAIVVATEPPVSPADGTIWVKPLSSVSAAFTKAVASQESIEGNKTLTTATAVADPGGSGYKYKLKFPVHANTSSGSGIDVTATVGGLTFTQHIAQGSYASGFDRVFSVEVTSNTWICATTSLTLVITASGGTQGAYKINGAIELTASYNGGTTGWKSCEVKVYKE